MVVLVIIYMLIVGWFQDFKVPFVMLSAIPLSLIGIVLGHWILNAYFTATSMIGFIALAGVMVRNSVLLIDFINIRLEEGVPLFPPAPRKVSVHGMRWRKATWPRRSKIAKSRK